MTSRNRSAGQAPSRRACLSPDCGAVDPTFGGGSLPTPLSARNRRVDSPACDRNVTGPTGFGTRRGENRVAEVVAEGGGDFRYLESGPEGGPREGKLLTGVGPVARLVRNSSTPAGVILRSRGNPGIRKWLPNSTHRAHLLFRHRSLATKPTGRRPCLAPGPLRNRSINPVWNQRQHPREALRRASWGRASIRPERVARFRPATDLRSFPGPGEGAGGSPDRRPIGRSCASQAPEPAGQLGRRPAYPPDKQEKATRTVLEQAKVPSAGWAE